MAKTALAGKTRPTKWDSVPEVFDYTYAALIVGYTPHYLAKLIRNGRFPGRKCGKKIICTKEGVRAWLDGVTVIE